MTDTNATPATQPSESPQWITAEEIFSRVGFERATRAIQRALREGLDPAADFTRSILDVENGQLLLMPSHSQTYVGVKVATVAPGNPSRGKERIQGTYLLMAALDLSPVAFMDGTALTTLRTPAVSAAAADLLAPRVVHHLVVFGSGPQAKAHVEALSAIRSLERVTIVGRNPDRADALVTELQSMGMQAQRGTADAVRDAQVIVCATTSATPVFDGSLAPDDSCTIAVGSHEAGARELDSALARRAQFVVEDITVALREAGDVIIPIGEGALHASELISLRDLLTGAALIDTGKPRVFKSSGMPWEDLVIAAEVYSLS
jgi:ornithine cyclodeaminase/alanine dehydrogenase-like protein (mu-crystallin family)